MDLITLLSPIILHSEDSCGSGDGGSFADPLQGLFDGLLGQGEASQLCDHYLDLE